MSNCSGSCDGCSCDENPSSSGGNYITGMSVFDRRENELTHEDVDCEFKIGDCVYNPNTREYGVINGYRKKLGTTFVIFEITGIYTKKDDKLFSNDNTGKVYLVEPCFIVRDKEKYEMKMRQSFSESESEEE